VFSDLETGGQDLMSPKVIEGGDIWNLGYGFLFDFYRNHGSISHRSHRHTPTSSTSIKL